LGTIISSNLFTKTGLKSNTWYDFYVRSSCGNTNSLWSGPIAFNTLADYCNGDHFYDNAGPNFNYPSYDYLYKTIYPTGSGNRVKAIFNSFQLGNYSYFQVYSGTTTSYEKLLFSYNGTNSPTTLTSTDPTGALTFVFNGDYNTTASGWDASIVCEPIPPCFLAPTNISQYDITTSAASFSWAENYSASTWEIEIVVRGTTPTGLGTIISSNPFTKTGLKSNTNYDLYIRSKCSNTNSEWSGPFAFNTLADYCKGDHLYDNGGAIENYRNNTNETKVIYPSDSSNKVSVSFVSLDLENCCDYLKIYDGPNSNSPLLFSSSSSVFPGTISSTDATGALTFVFTSDSSVTRSGWEAMINCSTLSNSDKTFDYTIIDYYPNPVMNTLNVKSKETINTFELYDMNSRLILKEAVNKNEFEIDFSNNGSGVYLVKLFSSDQKTKELKIIKK
jgi:hypothetical protein